MARPIILSNGRLHVGLNLYGEVHDFYYPHLALENHASAKNMRHHVGVWVDGQMSWLDDGNWQFHYEYHEAILIGSIRAVNHGLGISLEFDDAVDASEDIFMRNIHIINRQNKQRDVRLFMHQVFDIGDSASNGDTVQYLPEEKVILHYRGHRFFVIDGMHSKTKKGFDQYSVGLFGIEGHAGTYMDAEDGQLAGNTVEHGRVDSVISFEQTVQPHCSYRVNYWIAAGRSQTQALSNSQLAQKDGLHKRLSQTGKWWQNWMKPALGQARQLEPPRRKHFLDNVLLIKAHIDNQGAVIASTDTTMLKYARDAYGYCWIRDGAYAIWPLLRMGYTEEPLDFINFCCRIQHPDGYIMHKYQADGALGSSWHPYLQPDGTVAPPIQEDETAIALFIFAQYYDRHPDQTLLGEYYPRMVKPMADFLCRYIDPTTGLPKPSYDLWEERFLTTTYTTALVYRALLSCSKLAENYGSQSDAVHWQSTADDIGVKARHHLYDEETKALRKGLSVTPDKKIVYDNTMDASAVFGAYFYGLFDTTSDVMTSSITALKQRLSMPQPDVPGIARYENDYYNRVSMEIPGNPWFITTLWLAQYENETNQPKEVKKLLEWCEAAMMSSGVLPEQVNPYSGEYVSVAPLCWSQSEYVSTVLDMIAHKQPTSGTLKP